ncbi:peptidase domain-containing ABC transporter [Qipengyuania sp. GH1]|uniref:peptidase domain-containing ABC transporter n=1 Tax=Qipengyuania aestuarii TaxID=2867241 RepID=UPI001C883929|nr:peptidase domain-containing ABC transporter [Qipengyuania aestuarii]MBX7535153.1 peptidase domain-containing ABC transporter [Qipengyuania aestuarii]
MFESHIRLETQTEIAECGLAALAMVARFHGLDVDLGSLRRRFTAPTRGASLSSIMNCAEQLNFIVRPLRIELEDLGALQLPAILHWNMNHFVVLERVKGSKAWILDPAGSSGWLKIEEVSRRFTGVALELAPSVDFQGGEYRHRPKLKQLWSSSAGLSKSLGQVLLLSLVAQALLLILPFFSQIAIDRAVAEHSHQTLTALAVGFGLIAAVHALVYWLRATVLLSSGANLSYGLSSNLARRLFRLPIAWFNNRHVGDVLARFQSLKPIKSALTEDTVMAALDGTFALITLIVMFFYSPYLAMIPATGFIIYFAIKGLLFDRDQAAQQLSIIASSKEQSFLIETLKGIRSIRLSNKGRNRELRWRTRLVDSINAETNAKRISNVQMVGKTLITNLENVVFLWVSFSLVISGSLSLGAAFALYAYKVHFSSSSVSLIEKVWQFRLLGMHLDRIADIALSPEDVRFNESPRAAREIRGGLELRDIWYRYSNFDKHVVKSASMRVEPGESVAITGRSGEGKSTLAQILLGLLDPEEGELLVDDLPLSIFGYEAYHSGVAAVLQDDCLFAGSIFDNISLFDAAAEESEVVRSAQIADIDADIRSMPMGYDTLVGDMGAALSGGQKQRILLARALYQKPRILILDESTSHLDVASERRVGRAVADLGITRIIIAHREETIRTADRVFEMKGGSLTEISATQKEPSVYDKAARCNEW